MHALPSSRASAHTSTKHWTSASRTDGGKYSTSVVPLIVGTFGSATPPNQALGSFSVMTSCARFGLSSSYLGVCTSVPT